MSFVLGKYWIQRTIAPLILHIFWHSKGGISAEYTIRICEWNYTCVSLERHDMDNQGFIVESPDQDGDTPIRTIPVTNGNVAVKPTDGENTSEMDHRYGWFGWKPDFLQKINRPVWLLVFMSCYSCMQVCLFTCDRAESGFWKLKSSIFM